MRVPHLQPAAFCVAALLTTSVVAGGCVHSSNRALAEFAASPIEEAAEPSVAGLSRSDWAPVAVHVPAGEVAHGPTYVSTLLLDPMHARQAGGYPTIQTVTNEPAANSTRAAEGFIAYPWGGWLLLKAPFEMIVVRRPWETVYGPDPSYVRQPGAPHDAATQSDVGQGR